MNIPENNIINPLNFQLKKNKNKKTCLDTGSMQMLVNVDVVGGCIRNHAKKENAMFVLNMTENSTLL